MKLLLEKELMRFFSNRRKSDRFLGDRRTLCRTGCGDDYWLCIGQKEDYQAMSCFAMTNVFRKMWAFTYPEKSTELTTSETVTQLGCIWFNTGAFIVWRSTTVRDGKATLRKRNPISQPRFWIFCLILWENP